MDAFLFLRLSYFDCSDLQLFAIFMAEKLFALVRSTVCANSKQNSLLQFSSPHQLVVFLSKDPSLLCLV